MSAIRHNGYILLYYCKAVASEHRVRRRILAGTRLSSYLTTEIESGMELRDLLDDAEFPHRCKSAHDPKRASIALRRLAQIFANRPEVVLQELVDIAVEFCGADSAGISLEEIDTAGELNFRWVAVAGSFSEYLNGTTPRFFSPCGTCLSSGRAQLFRVTRPYYDYLGIVAKPITDGMLIPWISEKLRGTVWAVAHESRETFDMGDYELLDTLAGFVSIAVRHKVQEQALRMQVAEAASAARTNELAHTINNPLQSLTNTVYLASQGGADTQSYVRQASQELSELSEIVRTLLSLRVAHD